MDDNVLTVLAVVLVFAVGFALRFGAKYYANTKVALVMLKVEKELSTWAKEQAATGREKREAAISFITNKVYPFMPPIVKLFVSQQLLEASIDKLYGEMLDFFDDGSFNNSIE